MAAYIDLDINYFKFVMYKFKNKFYLSYEDTESLIPDFMDLYNFDEIIFSRNLYNILLSNKSVISTIEIPNIYLNDCSINNELLYSKTKINLSKNNDIIEKNKFETLYINIENQLEVLNNNNTNNPIELSDYCKLLLECHNNEHAFLDAKVCKLFVIYATLGSKDYMVTFHNIEEKKANIFISFVVEDNIVAAYLTNINNNVILEYDLSNLKVGTHYTINQKVEVK